MAEELEFPDGMLVKAPHAKAPSFVKASISIKVEEFSKWLQTKTGDEWVNLDVKESKGGKWYCAVSTYKPKPKEEKPKKQADQDDDVPF